MSSISQPYAPSPPLSGLLFYLSIIAGFSIAAYLLSGLASKLIKSRKTPMRLLSWTILIPLFLGLGHGCIYLWLVSMSHDAAIPDPFWVFSNSVLGWFIVFPANAILFAVWLLGALLIIRKNLGMTKVNEKTTIQ